MDNTETVEKRTTEKLISTDVFELLRNCFFFSFSILTSLFFSNYIFSSIKLQPKTLFKGFEFNCIASKSSW